MVFKSDRNTIIILAVIGFILILTSFVGINNIVMVFGLILLIVGAFLGLKKYVLKKRRR